MTLIKVLINWQKRTDGFGQLLETSNNGILGFFKFRSTAKIRQFFFGSWSNFLINWKALKNSVNWLWKFRSTDKTQFRSTDKTQFWSTDFWSNDPLSPFWSVWSSVCLSTLLSVCLFLCISDCLFAYLSVCLSCWLSVWVPVYLSVCLFVCVFLSLCLLLCLPIFLSFVCLSVCSSVSVFVCVCSSNLRNMD